MAKQGNIGVTSENIFPIIKKFLYSDHEIFLRELVSNAVDATQKLKTLASVGEFKGELGDLTVHVSFDDNTITISDRGIGMTAEEIDKYINQIAFSGAEEFVEKYKNDAAAIIGHFGLGFYSAFMVADKVTIDSLSHKEGAESVHWESEAGVDFEMSAGNKTDVGTSIKLYLNEDSYEFCNEYRAKEVLEKYCSFMPSEIYLEVNGKEMETQTIDEEELLEEDVIVERFTEEAETEEVEKEDGTKELVETKPAKNKVKIQKRPVPVNEVNPLWNKHPNDCTEEEYRNFYRSVFHDYKEPLFWIHLNMDYPFKLKGILYFPKINIEYESAEGVIKLYNNQVFIADNIKEVIPEFLMLLKGVIDCPDLPLNVSRSALQNDGFVKKISDYITKKVADKLSGMCKTDRENYEKYWDDINPFIKYGCLKDEKFDKKMKDFMLYHTTENTFVTLADELEKNKEKYENKVFYTDDVKAQAQYISMFKNEEIEVVVLNQRIDTPYIQHLEQANEDLKFVRVDSDLNDIFKDETDEEQQKQLEENGKTLGELYKKVMPDEKIEVALEKLKDAEVASVITFSEEGRRMQDMMRMYGMDPSMFGSEGLKLVLNANHPLVDYILNNGENEHASDICEQLYDLALLKHGSLSPERMAAFVTRSNKLMMELNK